MSIDFNEIDWFVDGVSGGKDSTALLLWLKYEFFPSRNIPSSKLICTFADTQWESEITYEHVRLISNTVHPVIWLESEGLLNQARRKKRFASTRVRFCTQELKLNPTKNFLNTYLDGKILSVNGIRAEESQNRKKMTEFGNAMETYHGYPEWRPLIEWKLEDVFLIHKKHNFPLNPLYGIGFERVGCMPCVMSKKKEIRLMAKHFPDRVQMIKEAENSMTGRNGFNSFFPRTSIPERYRTKEITTKDGEVMKVGTIEDVVEWSKTSDRKRSSNYDFHFEDFESPFEERSCMAGVCE